MPNFFSDNKDLQFQFQQLDLEHAVDFLEHHYQPDESEPLRPNSYTEAMDTYRAALELCGDISANFIAPRSEVIDKDGAQLKDGKVEYATATLEAQRCLAEAGFMGVIIPRKFGGMNFPATIYIMMIEMVSQADASMMTMFGYQDVGEAIAHLAPEQVALDFLPEYCEGKKIGAMVLTEPGGGSDLQAVQLKASEQADGSWRLNGVKQFISHGNGDVLLVLARSEADSPGMFGLSLYAVHGGEKNSIQVTHVEEKMGLHGSPTCELSFENARAELVGKQKFGLFHVVDILNHARFSVAAQAIGIAQSAYSAALEYAGQRKAFGKLIVDMPPVADLLIDMQVNLVACRAMIYAGTQWLDLRNRLEEHISDAKVQGIKVDKELRSELKQAQKMLDLLSPLVKYIATETANRICYNAQQVHGGIGYIREMTVERCVRDVRITTIYEGTTQVQVGLAIKHVNADVLGEFFDQGEASGVPEALESARQQLVEIRSLFKRGRENLRNREDDLYKDAAAKELTDIYGSLYAGHLLLASACDDSSRTATTRRYVRQSLAAANAGLCRIEAGVFEDVGELDQICL